MSQVVFSQDTTSFLYQVSNNLEFYETHKTPEKIYLHLDKTMYKQGDNIWYNVFLTNGITHKLEPVSSIVYIELINPKGQVQEKRTLVLSDGVATGNFPISYEEKGGLYKIKAYTIWMQNFKNPPIFEKELIIQKVITPAVLLKLDFDKESYGAGQNVVADLEVKNLKNNPITDYPVKATIFINNQQYKNLELKTDSEGKLDIDFKLPENLATTDVLINILVNYTQKTESISRSVPIQLNNIDLMFFPEGGDLLADANNNVAFMALNEFGLPADIEGVILDNDNKIVQNFKSYHQGMGSFEFKPEKNKTYKAQILKPVKLDTLFVLPTALNSGFSLLLNNVDDNKISLDIFSKSKQKTHLIVTIRDKEYYLKEIKLKKGNNKIEIPTTNFPSGIVRITLFDENNLPHCERLVYFGELSPLNIELKLKKDEFGIEENTKLEIICTQNGEAVSARLSLAIVDEKNLTFADDKQDNILSWFLMSSELKGEIYEPSFYFDKEELKAEKALDLVLMTHGWRRFTWKQILNEEPKISYMPEQQRNISGQITLANNKGVQATVWLFEQENKKRAAHLKTTKDGYFIFTNIDPTSNLQIVAKYKNKKAEKININILQNDNLPETVLANSFGAFVPVNIIDKTEQEQNKNYKKLQQDNNENEVIEGSIIKENIDGEIDVKIDVENNGTDFGNDNTINNGINGGTDFGNMGEENNIQNVVVTALGIKRDAKAIGYSVTTVGGEEITKSSDRSALNALSGKVAGVKISNASGAAGSSTRVIFRGFSSVSGSSSPLYVINGLPFDVYLDINTFIDPANIESITVLKGSSATTLYGSGAVNGAIVITTKTNSGYNNYRYNNPQIKKTRHKVQFISKLMQTSNNEQNREYYNPKTYWKQRNERETTNSTVFWKNDIITNEKGIAKIEFYCPDEVSTFRIVTEGISENGGVGRGEKNLNIIKPVNIETKIPYELSFNDTIFIPVIVANSTKKAITGKIEIKNTGNLQPISDIDSDITILPNSSEKQLFAFRVLPVQSKEVIEISFKSGKHNELVKREVDITSKGFPIAKSFSGDKKQANYTFEIEEPLEGSLHGTFNLYSSILDDLVSGMEGMLRQPYGCFMQTSSITYPNVLVLRLLKETGNSNSELEARALGYIEAGYKRLLSYKSQGGGFEWFGGSPGNVYITSFGLLQFTDMQKVYQGVDNEMLIRTKKWLMSKRDGNGNFKHSYGSYLPVSNAYIIYALARSGEVDIQKEYEVARDEALRSKDTYRLGLVTNVAFYLNKKEDFELLLKTMSEELDKKYFDNIKIESSVTYSSGISLRIESASLYLLALLKQETKNVVRIQEVMAFIVENRVNGYYYNTQATAFVLTALTEYSRYFKKSKDDVEFIININGETIHEKLKYAELKTFSIDSLENYLVEGKQKIELKFLSEESVSYSFDFEWNSMKLEKDKKCKIALTTNIESTEIEEAGIVRMNIEIENITNNGVPMTIAEIGIPAGLSLQPWQLKELSEKETFDYYEIFDGKFVIYYRGLAPNEKRTIKLDLKAETPGTYTAPASSAYLYYTNEHKNWQEGTKIKIK